jgi:TetR/AcrR family transcriptional regulator, transcriptional repressor for nem operon
MPKPSHRNTILTKGLSVVLERGFSGASVRDIVQAAGVPQGSFTNHFASKEAFGLEILDLYFGQVRDGIRKTLRNDALPPLQRLGAWVDVQIRFLKKAGMRNGCLIGNFSIEAGDHSEVIRHRLVEIFNEIHRSVAYCLNAAVKAGELSPAVDCDELASFLYSSLQGAILQSKAEHKSLPLERFKKILFSTVLR